MLIIDYHLLFSDAIIEVGFDNMFPITISLPTDNVINLGKIELERMPVSLDEVVIYADRSSVKAGKRTLIPSSTQVARNYNTMLRYSI